MAKTLVKVAKPKGEKKRLKKTQVQMRNPNVRLVPLDEGNDKDPKISNKVFPETYYRYSEGATTAQQIVTILPNGTRVAWDHCGNCHQHIVRCSCSGGVHTSRSVEYLYDQTVALIAGEEWTPSHKNYKGSIFAAERAKRGDTKAKLVFPSIVSEKKDVPDDDQWKRDLAAIRARHLHTPMALDKTIKPKATPLSKPLKPMAKEATDRKALDVAAKRMESNLEAKAMKVMGLTKSAVPKKTLKKKVSK